LLPTDRTIPKTEIVEMTVSLIPYEALRAKCITYSKPHLWRLEKANKFPKRVPIGAGRYGYVEEEIDAYIAQKIAERDARSAA
jgi:prophage regulatory protein